MRINKILCLCLLITLLTLSGVVSGDALECTRDSFFPDAGNCGYDVSDYTLEFTWDADMDQWNVVEDMTFTAEWDTDELHFDFIDSYEFYGLTIDGIAVDFRSEGQDLTIWHHFDHDTEYHLYAGFRGKLDYGFIFDPDGSERAENNGFCMLNEPTNAWRFFICNDHPKDKATFHYSFTVPAGFTPAGVGRLLQIREPDGTLVEPDGNFERMAYPMDTEGSVTFSYAAEEPMAPYLFTVCAFPYDTRQKKLENGVVQLDFVDHSLGELYDEAWKLADQQEAIVKMFESYLGEYPYRDLGAIISSTRLGAALETQTRPMYDLSTLSGDVFAHELIHQWFGDLISVEDWSDVWIKEGAATYGEYLYLLHFEGQEAFESKLRHNYETIAAGTSYVRDMGPDMAEWFRMAADGREITAYDRETALQTAASFCRIDQDGTQRIDPEDISLPEGETVTIEQWISAMQDSCRTVRRDYRSMTEFYQMIGADPGLNKMIDHYPGPKEISSNTQDMYGYAPYYGASFVYYVLEQKLGAETFKAGMQLLLERYAFSTVNEEKFIETFSEAAGEDLTDLIKSWLYYGEGYVPDLPGIETCAEARSK